MDNSGTSLCAHVANSGPASPGDVNSGLRIAGNLNRAAAELLSQNNTACQHGGDVSDAKFLFVRLIHSSVNLYSLKHCEQCERRHKRADYDPQNELAP